MFYSLKLIALIDACIFYPAPVRDLLLIMAEHNLYTPRWTEQIMVEWKTSLLINRKDLRASSLNKTIEAINNAFPEANVTNYQKLINVITLPDANET